MVKRPLSPSQFFELRQALQVAALDAMLASRRWEPGDLVFQGGTSLHLAHGSPRFSEDLDFLVNNTLNLDAISTSVQARLSGVRWLPEGSKLNVSKSREGRNPHAFVLSISGDNILGGVKVKIELWQTAPSVISAVAVDVAAVQIVNGPMAGVQTFVPVATLSEVFADKVFAVVARDRLKPRDVFDLHWLVTRSGQQQCTDEQMKVRLATYPNTTVEAWLDKAFVRRNEMLGLSEVIADDLKRWLPSTWPMSVEIAQDMARVSVKCIEDGIDRMRDVRDELSRNQGLER